MMFQTQFVFFLWELLSMSKLRSSDIVKAIASLGTKTVYEYYTGKTKIKIVDVLTIEGPISFIRWDSKKETIADAAKGNLTKNQIATVASVFSGMPCYPIHLDRLFSGSGNSRAALESLLAYTPNFFICYPQKTNPYTGESEKKLKHLMWCPDESHPLGQFAEKEYDQVISEVEFGLDFGEITLTLANLGKEFASIDTKRTHTQMQVALVKIGNALGFKTWIASGDRSILVGGKPLGEMEGVIQSLDDVPIFHSKEIRARAQHIDAIWFTSDFKYMPAVIEVEHSTGVVSGLTRMLKLQDAIPSMATKYTVVAITNLRNKIVTEANLPTFKILDTKFMTYSTVKELYGLIQKYSISGVAERNFIEPFMERVVEP
jgi:type II restriction enzyme